MKPILFTILFISTGTVCFPQSVAHQRNGAMAKGVNLAGWLEFAPVNPMRFVKSDFYDFAEAGFSTVRMPVRFAAYLDSSAPYALDTSALAFQMMDSVIAWSRELGLHVIIDNHHGWEALGNSNYPGAISRMGAMWRQVAERYKHLHPDSVFFEVINEPSYFLSGQPFTDFMQAMIDTIRLHAPNHTIIVSAPWAGSQVGFNYLTPFPDTNLIYTFHFYTPLNFTHQGATWTPVYFPIGRTFPENGNEQGVAEQFNLAAGWMAQYQKPVFLGEFGVIAYADSASRCNWISLIGSLIDAANLSWAYWDWASPGNINFGFFNDRDAAPENTIPCFGEALRLYGMEPSSAQTRENEFDMHIFPNPANGECLITFPPLNGLDVPVIFIYNSLGQVVFSSPLSQEKTLLNISALHSGLYFAEIYSGGGRLTGKKLLIR